MSKCHIVGNLMSQLIFVLLKDVFVLLLTIIIKCYQFPCSMQRWHFNALKIRFIKKTKCVADCDSALFILTLC